jgi:hypothetical protein
MDISHLSFSTRKEAKSKLLKNMKNYLFIKNIYFLTEQNNKHFMITIANQKQLRQAGARTSCQAMLPLIPILYTSLCEKNGNTCSEMCSLIKIKIITVPYHFFKATIYCYLRPHLSALLAKNCFNTVKFA